LNKAPEAFRTISEVADELGLPQHVLRFWESRFPHIRPMKRGGGRRYYRPEDVDLLRGIRHLLYGDGYTIRGVQRILREQGVRTVQSVGQGHAVNLPVLPRDEAPEDDEVEGARGIFKFLPRFSGGPAQVEAEEEEEEREAAEPGGEEPALPEDVPEERPNLDAKSPPVSPAAREPTAEQASVPQASAAQGSAPQVAQATLPLVAPPSKSVRPEDLERLRRALVELEACRRLLDKTNEGGR
jgi:DNA-binding transcriptional MerR regulator